MALVGCGPMVLCCAVQCNNMSSMRERSHVLIIASYLQSSHHPQLPSNLGRERNFSACISYSSTTLERERERLINLATWGWQKVCILACFATMSISSFQLKSKQAISNKIRLRGQSVTNFRDGGRHVYGSIFDQNSME